MKNWIVALLLLLTPVTVSAQTAVVVRGKASTVNATTTPLVNAGVFTGTFEDTRDYPSLTVAVFSDKASATDGLEVQWSSDAVNVDFTDLYTIAANVGRSWTLVTSGRYFKLRYTNGAVTQTAFRLSAVLRQSGSPSIAEGASGLTDAELRATPVPVSGTVTATPTGTQTVSGTVTVTDGSGALNTIIDSGSVTVSDGAGALNTIVDSGTLIATQATGTNLHTVVDSGAVTVSDGSGALNVIVDSAASNASTNVAQVGGTATDTNSGSKSAGTLRVVLATDQPALTNKLLVTPDSVALPANQSVNMAQVAGSAVATGNGTAAGSVRVALPTDGTGVVGLNAGTNRIGSVRPVDSADADLTSAKASQTSRALGTQDLKDAGRTAISFYANNVASGTTTSETLITLVQSKGTGSTSSATTYTPTSGKRFRITGLSVGSRGHSTATIQSTVFNLRLNTGGACLVGSTPIIFAAQSATAAVASAWDRVIIPIPDGYEIAGDGTASICISAAATFTTNAPTWSVNLIGYEY